MNAHTPHDSGLFAHHAVRLVAAAVALSLFSTAMWFVWLGWDTQYHQVDGVPQGPYREWQVIGCALSIAAAAVSAYLWTRGAWAVLLLAAAGVVGFAVPWTQHAAATDDSGLFVVGLLFLLVGGGIALTTLLAVTAAIAGAGRGGAAPHRDGVRGLGGNLG